MPWYRIGTVNVTNGSPAVVGVGTAWRQQAKQGDIFRGPDRGVYEILSVNSDTSITLAENYIGTTQTGQPYSIAPTQGFVRDLTEQVQQLIQEYDPALLPAATTPMLDSDKAIVDQGGITAVATLTALRDQLLKTSPLPAATATIDDADQFLLNQSGQPKRVPAAQMRAAFGGVEPPATSLPQADVPLNAGDLFVVTQGGTKKKVSNSELLVSIEALLDVLADIAGGNSFSGAQTVSFVALTDAATIATDASLSNHFAVTLAGNRTLANPTNMRDGGIYNWRIRQDGTGSRTLGYGNKFKWPGGTAPTLSTAANAIDRLTGQYIASADVIECVITKDFR